jgi:hypothetical protein
MQPSAENSRIDSPAPGASGNCPHKSRTFSGRSSFKRARARSESTSTRWTPSNPFSRSSGSKRFTVAWLIPCSNESRAIANCCFKRPATSGAANGDSSCANKNEDPVAMPKKTFRNKTTQSFAAAALITTFYSDNAPCAIASISPPLREALRPRSPRRPRHPRGPSPGSNPLS